MKIAVFTLTFLATVVAVSGHGCLSGWADLGNQCFLVQGDKTDATTANKNCQAKGGVLAEVRNQKEHDALYALLVKNGIKDDTWIGLNRKKIGWNYRGKIASYFNFIDGQPDNSGGVENCVEMILSTEHKGKWNDDQCVKTNPSVCSSKACDAGWFGVGNKCFHIQKTKMDASAAAEACKAKGGVLAAVENEEENTAIANNLRPAQAGYRAWIGLKREGGWTYDGKKASYLNWINKEPNNSGGNEDCVEVNVHPHYNGKWNDRRCDTAQPSVCMALKHVKPAVKNCYEKDRGVDYRGTVAVTSSGKTCQKWKSQEPHRHPQLKKFDPEDKAGIEGNFCRNPDNDSKGLWCYTTDPKVRYEYCNIPRCE